MELQLANVGLGNAAVIPLEGFPFLFDCGSVMKPGVLLPSDTYFDGVSASILACAAQGLDAELSVFLSHAHKDHFNHLAKVLGCVLDERPLLQAKIYVNCLFDGALLGLEKLLHSDRVELCVRGFPEVIDKTGLMTFRSPAVLTYHLPFFSQ
jgi:hypothetical protein